MKKTILALVILGVGAGAFCGLRARAAHWEAQLATAREALAGQNKALTETRSKWEILQERVRDLSRGVHEQRRDASGDNAVSDVLTNGARLTAAQREQLLAELGFNWRTTGDYLIVSKETLRAISFGALRDAKLSDTACAVLSVTPDERASVDATAQSLNAALGDWTRTHAQREDPSGDVVAKYTLPTDADFSQSLSNQFASSVVGTLGDERGELLLQYAHQWMSELGMENPGSQTLTVSRYPNGDTSRLSFSVSQSTGAMMSTDVSPYQPFPPAFQPLFPNGWSDLAQREGFALPPSFGGK